MWLIWLACSCRLGDGPGHAITGTVLHRSTDRVVLDHEPVEGVMPAMVMELMVPRTVQLRRGDRIEGLLKMGDGPARLEQVRIVGNVDLDPPAAKGWGDSLLLGERLESLTIESTAGPVRIGEGQGRTTVLTFLFTRCPVPEFCPLLVTKLAALQGRIGGARIVAVTLDPAYDTVERLAAYGTQAGADPAVWVLGRLPQDRLDALLARVDVDVERRAGVPTHDLRLLVLDADGRLVHREQDNGWDVEELAAVVRAAAGPHSAGL